MLSANRRKRPLFRRGYLCGPTLYKDNHQGNYLTYFRSIEDFKRIKRSYRNQTSVLVMNITDISPKIYDRIKLQKNILHVSQSELNIFINQKMRTFIRHLKELGLNPNALEIKRVSFQVRRIRKCIRTLVKKGIVHASSEGYRFSQPENKELGFLWKFTPNYPYFYGPSTKDPLGTPGWHIECAYLISNLINDSSMVHYSGVDLKEIHNHNEEVILSYLRPDLSLNWVFWQPLLIKTGESKLSKSTMEEELEIQKNPNYLRFFVKNYLNGCTKTSKPILDSQKYLDELKRSYVKPLNLKKRKFKHLYRLLMVRESLRQRRLFNNANIIRANLSFHHRLHIRDSPLSQDIRSKDGYSFQVFKVLN